MHIEPLKILLFESRGNFPDVIEEFLKRNNCSTTYFDNQKLLIKSIKNDSHNLLIYFELTGKKKLGGLFKKLKEIKPSLLICLIGSTVQPKAENYDFYFNINDGNEHKILMDSLKVIIHMIYRELNYTNLSSMILHDLRSPAQSISGYIDLLAGGIFGSLNEGQLKIIRNTSALSDKLIDLLEDLNRIYSFEMNRFVLKKTKFYLKDLIEQSLRSIWVQTDQKNIKLIPNITPNLPIIHADPDALQRVIINLLSNAIKYCPENGTIRIFVQSAETSAGGEMINFKISDTGPGIVSEDSRYLFDRYYQSGLGRNKNIRGFGLGLYISRLIVDAHDGQIGAHNNREGGATFYFNIPVGSKTSRHK